MRKVFGNRGSTEMPFLADFPGDIDYVLGLHEGAVVRMADVYAQLTGERTLVNLHTAVGLGNAMVAIINAASGHSPLVITAGQQVRATLTMQPLLANTDPTMLPRPASRPIRRNSRPLRPNLRDSGIYKVRRRGKDTVEYERADRGGNGDDRGGTGQLRRRMVGERGAELSRRAGGVRATYR